MEWKVKSMKPGKLEMVKKPTSSLGTGKVSLKSTSPKKKGSQMGDDARKGLSKPGYGK